MPDPWWWCYYTPIEGFYRLDDYTVDILLKDRNLWMAGLIVGNIVVPQHIWQSYIETHTEQEIRGDFSTQPSMLTGTGPFKFVENTPNSLTMVRNSLYYQSVDKCVNSYQPQRNEGITIEPIQSSTAISPNKIEPDHITNKGNVRINVPITNLNTKLAQEIAETIELVKPDHTVEVLADISNLALDPGEVHLETFDRTGLNCGEYTIRVTVQVTGGNLSDWIHANLPPDLWDDYLGPVTVEETFDITVPADINEDGVVDIFDITPIAVAFGSIIGDPSYNRTADLNRDGVVDIFDIIKTAVCFGWTR